MDGKGEKFAWFIERRSGTERRSPRSLPMLFSSGGRRGSAGRRSSDAAGYVDRYDLRTWAIAISVLLLSILDAVLTTLQIGSGHATEANPLMDRLLRSGGPYTFFGLKAAITALAIAVIVLHKEWKIGRLATRVCLWSYILLSVYHLYLVYLTSHFTGS